VALLAALLLGGIGLQLVNPQILRAFIDTAETGGALRTLLAVALIFLGVALAGQVVTVAETYLAESIGWRATNRLRAELALHCLKLDAAFHGRHTPGELLERIDGDVSKLGNFFSRFVVALLGNALLTLGILALLFRVDPRIGLASTAFVAVAFAVINAPRNLAVPHWTAARAANAALFGFLEERFAGTEDLRANGATAYALRRFGERARAVLRAHRTAALFSGVLGGTTTLLFVLGTALAIGLGAYLYRAGAITIGTVYLLFAYTELLRRPIEQITRQLQDWQQAAAAIARVRDLLGERSAVRDGPGVPLPAGPLAVEFRAVSFTYPTMEATGQPGPDPDGAREPEPTLAGLSFAVPPGGRLGLLGRTGSGKTTVARLLHRLYDPHGGSVLLGGADLRDARLGELRARVGVVTQDIQLFHATVRDNLTFFDRAIPDAPILRTLDDLGLDEWRRALPRGLDTILAPGGGGLSAGEAQLLAFARVFLRDPGLVILDEATSRLDPATEARIERATDRLLAGRTAIIIAHRLATVARADDILILEGGRVAEYGPRAALAADPASRFAGLLRLGLANVAGGGRKVP
jgi:ATP-binding cassette subfamily B protein